MIAFDQVGPLIPIFLAGHPAWQPHFTASAASPAGLRALLRWVLAQTDLPPDVLPHVHAGLALLADLAAAEGRDADVC